MCCCGFAAMIVLQVVRSKPDHSRPRRGLGKLSRQSDDKGATLYALQLQIAYTGPLARVTIEAAGAIR